MNSLVQASKASHHKAWSSSTLAKSRKYAMGNDRVRDRRKSRGKKTARLFVVGSRGH